MLVINSSFDDQRENSVTVACGVNEELLVADTDSFHPRCLPGQSRCLDDVFSGNISLVTAGMVMTLADVLVTMSCHHGWVVVTMSWRHQAED